MNVKIALVLIPVAIAATLALGADEPGSVWDGVYTEEQAARGETFYEQGCAECHGLALEGDDMSTPLVGSDFLWAWDGLSLGDLFERIRISMPDGKANSMTRQEKADVLAYVLSKNEMPAGEKELPPRAADLNPVAFKALRPDPL